MTEMQTLLDAARSGDRYALNRLLESCQSRLRALTDRVLGDGLAARTRASDILQSTYVEVVRHIADFRGEDERAFCGWVGKILENQVRAKARYFAADCRNAPAAEEVEPTGREPTPSTEIQRVEDLVTMSAALESLPPHYRQVIVMRTVDGLDYTRIAAAIGKSTTATRMMLSRARARLCLEIERLER